jgi:nitrous oxidase accessory protein
MLGLVGLLAEPGGELPDLAWQPPDGIPPARPACDRELAPSQDLQAAVEDAADGAILCLSPGSYDGPLVIRRPVVLWGPRQAVIRSTGQGTTIEVVADGSRLLGFSVDGSGGRYDTNDAAVRVAAADVAVEGLFIEDALFGVLAEDATRLSVRGNVIVGDRDGPIGMRGDAIRFWGTTDSLVEGNRISYGRDVVMWYSARNRLVRNTVEHGRYGTHFMYSHNCRVEENVYAGNVVGVFIMYTHGIELIENVIAGQSGAGGLGLGLKDADDIVVRGNQFINNRVHLRLDTSPTSLEAVNTVERNHFRLGQVGVSFHGRGDRNRFFRNSFRDNQIQVQVDGGGDALDAEWRENHFDDYRGYDLDGDGLGDIPFELRSFSNELTSRRPQLGFLRGTSALWLIEISSHVSPMFQPKTIVVDATPRLRPPPLEQTRAD